MGFTMIGGHGGNIFGLAKALGCRLDEIIDVSSNINPCGPPPGLMDYLARHLAAVCSLPEVDNRGIIGRMAGLIGVDEHRILAGAGTTPLIYALFPAIKSENVLILGPTYADYADACRRYHLHPQYFLATPADRFQPDFDRLDQELSKFDTVVICNPNNPTGVLLSRDVLIDLAHRHPDTRFIIDESYLPLAVTEKTASITACYLPNVVVFHSISKIFGVPGLRVGFVIAPKPIIRVLSSMLFPWSINSLAHVAVNYICDNKKSMADFVRRSRAYIENERTRFFQNFETNKEIRLYPSNTNFFLVGLARHLTAETVCDRFSQKRILVRNCANFPGLGNRFIRIALKSPDVNHMVADILASVSECKSAA